MDFLRSFLKRQFAEKPVVASRNVGFFLRLGSCSIFARQKPKIPFLVVPRSFFAPKPHGNACYAGWFPVVQCTVQNRWSNKITSSWSALSLFPFIPKVEKKSKIRERNLQISFFKMPNIKHHHVKELLKRFHLNGHTIGFHPHSKVRTTNEINSTIWKYCWRGFI